MKLNLGDIIIYNRGNEYQQWALHDFTRRNGHPIRRIEVSPKYSELVWLKYASKGIPKGKMEARYLDFDEGCKNLTNQLLQLDIKKSIYFITVATREQYVELENFQRRGMEVKKIPRIVTYQEKLDTLERIIKRWKIDFESKKIKTQLLRLMIRHEDSWDDVLFTAEMLNETCQPFTLEYLEDLYPDESFYRLDDYLYNILQGLQPRKTIEMSYYFMEDKGYSARWMAQKLKEKVMLLSYGYQFYRRGVFNMVIAPQDLVKRINFKEIPTTTTNNLEWERLLTYYEQKKLLGYIEGVNYTEYQKIASMVYKLDDKVSNADIHRLIKEISSYLAENQEEE